MKKRILASLLALCLMGGMLPTAALASEPDITMPTTERKLEKNNGAPANRAHLRRKSDVGAGFRNWDTDDQWNGGYEGL